MVIAAFWCWWRLPARGGRGDARRLGDGRRQPLRLQPDAPWLHECKSAFIKRESVGAVAAQHRAGQGPAVHADPRHPRPARRLRHSLGRRPPRRAAARALQDRQPRLRPAVGELHLSGGQAPSRPPASTRRTRPSCATASCPATRRTATALDAQHNRPYQAPARRGARPGEPLPGAVAQGLRVPRRRPHVGAVQPGARRHKPTWTLSFDAKLDVFKDMRFDPLEPGRQHRGRAGLPPVRLVDVRLEAVPLVRPVLRRLVHAAGAHQRQPVPEVRRDPDRA